MKLLIIPHSPTFNSRSYLIAKHLVQLENSVHFLIWDPYPINIKTFVSNIKSSLKYNEYVQDGVKIHKIRRLPFFFPPVNKFLFKKAIHGIRRKFGIDLIISAGFINEVVPPFDIPMIYDLVDHHEAYVELCTGFIEKFGMKHILQIKKSIHDQIMHADATIVVSEILSRYVKDINPDAKIYKIYNGFDDAFINFPSKNKDYNFGAHSIAYVGLFQRFANFPKLINTIKVLRDKIPDIKLVIIGGGESIPEAKRIVNNTGLTNNVIFTGQIPHEKVPEIVTECAITVITLIKDLRGDCTSPITIMEYTALGKTVVSSNLEEVKLLNFPNIILYNDTQGVESLADAIEKAFSTSVNIENSRKRVRNYSWHNIAQQFCDIIRTSTNK